MFVLKVVYAVTAYGCRDMPWHVRIPQGVKMHRLMGGHATACPYKGKRGASCDGCASLCMLDDGDQLLAITLVALPLTSLM